MEVTTVSPSPASATEGDDLCEIDATSVAIHSVTLLISLCGLLGNGAVLCLLSWKCFNLDIYCLAVADFLVLLITVPSTILFLVEDVSCSPVMPLLYLSSLFQLSVFSCYWALFLVMVRSNINYMSKLYNLYCHCNLPWWLLSLVFSVQCLASFIFFFRPAVANLCPSHQQEHCRAALIPIYIIILLLIAAPTVIPTTINFINAKWGSMEQQPRRREIVVFLMVLFILLLSLCNFLQWLVYSIVSSEVLLLFNCIQTSIKPFIYFLAGGFRRPCSLGSLRLSLQRVFDEQKEEAAHSNDALMDTGI